MDSRIASTSSGSSDAAAPAARRGGAHAAPKPHSSALDVEAANKSPIKCPRCESLNTKFCYYNNYSQTQPRHYCKSCKRYWTEGGSLRNVPVGGGCRKNKRVKPRPLINLAGASGLLNPSSALLDDDTTSNMFARLSSTSPYPNFCTGASSLIGSEDASTHFMHIAISRFQESMRLRQHQQSSDQSPETAPYFDMSFPGLVHKQSAPTSCSCDACESRMHSLHHGLCSGVMNTFDGNLGFSNPAKLEHDVAMAGYCNGGYELNPMYHDQSANMHMVGTSATATLASIEDQLSSFSNLQHVDAFNADTSTGLMEQKCGASMDVLKRDMMSSAQFGQYLGLQVDRAGETMVDSAYSTDEMKERLSIDDIDEKPLLSSTTNNHDLSLVMRTDGSSWQQPSLMMSDMLLQGEIWNAHGARWQDNMQQAMAATSATAAGSVL